MVGFLPDRGKCGRWRACLGFPPVSGASLEEEGIAGSAAHHRGQQPGGQAGPSAPRLSSSTQIFLLEEHTCHVCSVHSPAFKQGPRCLQ